MKTIETVTLEIKKGVLFPIFKLNDIKLIAEKYNNIRAVKVNMLCWIDTILVRWCSNL